MARRHRTVVKTLRKRLGRRRSCKGGKGKRGRRTYRKNRGGMTFPIFKQSAIKKICAAINKLESVQVGTIERLHGRSAAMSFKTSNIDPLNKFLEELQSKENMSYNDCADDLETLKGFIYTFNEPESGVPLEMTAVIDPLVEHYKKYQTFLSDDSTSIAVPKFIIKIRHINQIQSQQIMCTTFGAILKTDNKNITQHVEVSNPSQDGNGEKIAFLSNTTIRYRNKFPISQITKNMQDDSIKLIINNISYSMIEYKLEDIDINLT